MSPLPDKVIVHPLVLLSVVDHYNRVAKDTKKRVVGALLGSLRGGILDISNSFAGVFSSLLFPLHSMCALLADLTGNESSSNLIDGYSLAIAWL